jgi:hypothetical protein
MATESSTKLTYEDYVDADIIFQDGAFLQYPKQASER